MSRILDLAFAAIAPRSQQRTQRKTTVFRTGSDRWSIAVGGATLAIVLALMIASMGSQTFYPREGAVGMWVIIGICAGMHTVSTAHDARPLSAA